MGIVRFVLAMVVLIGHTRPSAFLIGGDVAVELFFAISGFLISYILRMQPAYKDKKKFFVNRALRIYPIYFVVAIATLLLWVTRAEWLAGFSSLNIPTKVFLIACNVLLFGQDWLLFLQQDHGGLAPTADFRQTDPQLWGYALVPPAWSLGTELTFYALAPFIMRRRAILVTILTASFLAKFMAWGWGLQHDPWSFRFFPFELWVFLLGALSEQILAPVVAASVRAPAWGVASVLLTFAAFAAVPQIEIGLYGASFLLIFALVLALPGLMAFQRSRPWDVWIGDLSYPLYLCHWLVIVAVRAVGHKIPILAPWAVDVAIVILAVVLAIVLERFVTRPVERLRRKLRGTQAPIYALEGARIPTVKVL